MDDFPHLKRWWNAIHDRPAVKKAYEVGKQYRGVPATDPEARKILFGQTADTVRRTGLSGRAPQSSFWTTRTIAGPIRTTNSVGRMKTIIGTVRMAGRRAAFSSAFSMRSSRNSAASTRSACAKRRAVALGLHQRVDDAADRRQVGAPGEVLQRLAAVRQEAELDRGQAELVGELRRRGPEVARDAVERGVEAEARLGADDQKIERVGKLAANEILAPRDQAAKDEKRRIGASWPRRPRW